MKISLILNEIILEKLEILNSLLGKNGKLISDQFEIGDELVTDKNIIASSFSNFFISHPASIHENIPATSADFSNLIEPNLRTMVFFLSTEVELSKVITSLKNGGSIEDVPCLLLKISKVEISKLLSKLFNMCLEQGVYPDLFKVARITPVFKKGSRNFIKNHRPISILSNLSKIFDTLIYKRLLSFFNKFKILSDNQFGFRKNKNTELATLELVNKIMPAIENKLHCICVFLDYKACFDTICRKILLKKLDRYGIRGVGLKFLESYFTNRKQYVSFNSGKSELVNQNLGVIQGSKIGPLFFDIYSNEFKNLLGNDSYILYADDTSVVYVGDDLHRLVAHVNNKLSLISEWCKFNKLSLNPEKSEFIFITSRKSCNLPVIQIDGNAIKQVNSAKYLGVFIDDHLKFHAHIEMVERKLAQFCGVSYRLKNHFNRSTALKFYYSCVYSAFNYCISVWGGVSICTGRCDRIIRLHRRIVLNLFSKYFSEDTEIFKSMEILKFTDIYKLRVAVYMFRMIQLNEFPALLSNLNLTYPDHNYETRNRDQLITPFPRIEAIRMNFKYQFSNIWNQVPESIKISPSIKSFKKSLAQFYLRLY